jgi:hypothetical protein
MGGGGASRALDRGWEAAAVAVDGEQELRRRSGGLESSRKREVSKMGVCKCKSKFTRSSRTCSGPEEGTVMREQLLPTGGVHGGSGGGGATWRGDDRASAGWGMAARALGRHMA